MNMQIETIEPVQKESPVLLTSLEAPQRFQLKLAKLAPGVHYVGLSFNSYLQGDDFAFGDPLTTFVCGETIDYGSLFAYCFRRFGYPNAGWDDHKELAEYLLTTSSKDLILGVVPYVGSDSDLHFRFLVPKSVLQAVEDYDCQERTDWRQEAITAAVAEGLPEWMTAWLDLYAAKMCGGIAVIALADWALTLPYMDNAFVPAGVPEDDPDRALVGKAHAFREGLLARQTAVRPEPDLYRRHLTRGTWRSDDPLKPIAEAAMAALKDLSRPVNVRDNSINAYGLVEDGDPALRRGARPAAVSGYPSGALGNEAPKEFGELHGRILRMGKGNAKKGIQKVLGLLPTPKIRKSEA